MRRSGITSRSNEQVFPETRRPAAAKVRVVPQSLHFDCPIPVRLLQWSVFSFHHSFSFSLHFGLLMRDGFRLQLYKFCLDYGDGVYVAKIKAEPWQGSTLCRRWNPGMKLITVSKK